MRTLSRRSSSRASSPPTPALESRWDLRDPLVESERSSIHQQDQPTGDDQRTDDPKFPQLEVSDRDLPHRHNRKNDEPRHEHPHQAESVAGEVGNEPGGLGVVGLTTQDRGPHDLSFVVAVERQPLWLAPSRERVPRHATDDIPEEDRRTTAPYRPPPSGRATSVTSPRSFDEDVGVGGQQTSCSLLFNAVGAAGGEDRGPAAARERESGCAES